MNCKTGILLAWLALLTLGGCAQNPVSGGQDFVLMSEGQEVATGRSADEDVRRQYGVYDAPALQEYVNSVGQRVAKHSHRPGLQYHFTVLDTPEINAFALPGGYVYITRGILAYLNSEAELAAVLGHEIGHVTARHGVRQASATQVAKIGVTLASIFLPEANSANLGNSLAAALLSGYGREHELEADRLGAEYLARSEYDPQALIRVIGVLKSQEAFDAELAKREGRQPRRYHGLFATHPSNDARLQQAVGESSHLVVSRPREGYTDFLQHVEGVVFGDSRDQGVVRDGKFLHAGLGIALDFPRGWKVQNLPDKVIATSPASDAAIQLRMDEHPDGSPAKYAQRMVDFNPDYPVETLRIDGLPAAIVTIPAAMAGVVYFEGKAYIIEGKANSREAFARWRYDMLDAIKSFHELGRAERTQSRPLAIRLAKPREGDTYSSLARRSPLGRDAEGYLRLINGDYPSGEPVPGQYLKVVE